MNPTLERKESSLSQLRKNEETSDDVGPPLTIDQKSKDGSFQRRDAGWRGRVKDEEGADFPAEPSRYHLYVAAACPWAHRTLIVRKLKGLEDVISITMVMPTFQPTNPGKDSHHGWVFADPNGEPYKNAAGNGGPFPASAEGCEPDPAFGCKTIRELYERCGDTGKLYSVPILFDKKQKTIVSNESSEIIRMLNTEFNKYAKNPELDLYPVKMRDKIDAVNDWTYSDLNNGVYKCGFAQSQEAYVKAVTTLTAAFDRADSILKSSRFIAGNTFTEADIRLFVTLLRFDEVYNCYFKCNTRMVSHTPNLLNYVREIYQMPGVKDTINMDQIKQHYYTSHPTFNHFSIIPLGPGLINKLEEPHNRWKVGNPIGLVIGSS